MPSRNAEFLERLMAAFKAEAEEHLRALSSGLVAFEQEQDAARRKELLELLFREAHSLKGAARSVNLKGLERLCHAVESLFAEWKAGTRPLQAEVIDVILEAMDGVLELERGASRGEGYEAATLSYATRVEGVIRNPQSVRKNKEVPPPPAPDDQPPEESQSRQEPEAASESVPSTVRIPVSRLESLLQKTEALVGVKLNSAHRLDELRELSGAFDQLMRRGGDPGGDVQEASNLRYRVAGMVREARADLRQLEMMVDSLQEELKQVLMLPFGMLFAGLPRMVREVAREQAKEVNFEVSGAEREVDRRILEEIRSPLVHLLRNAVDHGIEQPDARARGGKPRQATVRLSVVEGEGGQVELVVEDDGRGFDPAALRESAVKAGILTAEASTSISDEDAQRLAFHSGLSTSPIVTSLSGRGLGLSIVQDKVERVGGTLRLESRPGAGAKFTIVLPVTLSTFRGTLLRSGDQQYLVPAQNTQQVLKVSPEQLMTIENRPVIRLNGHSIPAVGLDDLLEVPRRDEPDEDSRNAVIVTAAGEELAILVDRILGHREVVVKSWGKQLLRVRNISGAAVLGTGSVVPILHVNDLLKTAKQGTIAPVKRVAREAAGKSARRILVAEDSITARTLLRNILETAGYEVETAVDGAEALALARSGGKFDVVVSDVEMPRMTGFELTARLRADKRLSEVPVILVTALESRDDRERGIEAGANAYIVKRNFEQSDLLQTIERFI